MENIIIKFSDEAVVTNSLINQPSTSALSFNVLQHIPLPILSLSLGCMILDINQAAATLYGWERSKVLGKNFLELCLQQGYPTPVLPNLSAIKPGQAHGAQVMPFAPSDKTRELNWQIVRLSNEQQEGFLFIAGAASPTVEPEKNNESLRDLVQELLPSLKQILDTTTHLPATSAGTDIVSHAVKLVDRLENLENFIKIKQEGLTKKEEPCDLRLLVEKIGQQFTAVAQQQTNKLILAYPPQVPSQILIDAQCFALITKNLLSNACRHTTKGNIVLAVSYKAQVGQDIMLELKVQDTGEGIHKDDMATLFEPTQSYGLYLVKEWLQCLNGKLRIESQPQVGTTIVCTIPCKQLNTTAQALVLTPQSLKLLVVDDNTLRAEATFSHFATLSGSACLNGEETMACLIAKEIVEPAYHIVMVDDEIASVPPLAIARQMRSRPEFNNTLLVLSARSGTKLFDEAKAGGFDVVLSKPLQPSQMMQLLKNEWAAWQSDSARRVEQKNKKVLSVLLVEDNQLAQKISKSMLEDIGCRVDIASNGEEALKSMENYYDVVFMDVGLPDFDGLEVTRRIRKMRYAKSRVPIIAMTAHVSEHDKRLCFDAGMDDFISKPISYESLQSALQRSVLKAASAESAFERQIG